MGERTEIEPTTEVAVVIAVQKLGQATNNEIRRYIKENCAGEVEIPSKSLIKDIAERMKKKDIFSVNYVGAEHENAWSMAKPVFKNIPENAHLKDIVASEEAKEFLGIMEAKKGSGTKERKPDICNYVFLTVEFEVLDKILGGQMANGDGLQCLYKNAEGDVYIPRNWLYGWMRNNERLVNKTNAHRYMAFAEGKVILPKGGKIEIDERTITCGITGRGVVKSEALPSGTKISTRIGIPTSGGSNCFSVDEFRNFLQIAGESPINGLGAYGRKYGRVRLISYERLN